jgi:hypothetical protein
LYFTITDCKAIYDSGVRTDGVYLISPQRGAPFDAFCDMSGGGWTAVQRRFNGSESFARNYSDYVSGFGSVAGDYWIGLENIHLLTTSPGNTSSIRISVQYYNGTRVYQHYGNVSVDNSTSGYMIHVTQTDQDVTTLNLPNYGLADGPPYGGLYNNNGFPFTTLDHDADGWPNYNCASRYGGGGWWYQACAYIFVNAIYGQHDWQGISMGSGFDHYVTNPIVTVIRN